MRHARRLAATPAPATSARATHSLAASIFVTVLGLVALAGCTASDDIEAVPGWVEPGWMAQVRQQNEEFQTAMVSCYAEYGLKGTITMGGGVGFVNLPQDPATNALLEDSAEDCNARVPLPDHQLNKALDDAAYQRMLETRECIIAHGYEVSEPPSAETWKDSSPWWFAWNPYQEFINGPAQGSMPDAELFALDRACPQAGPNFQILAPTGDA